MTSKPKVLLFNPRAANHKPRIPNSVLQVAASINHFCDWVIVDGNLEENPEEKIFSLLTKSDFSFFGSTVMPGPQLKQAIPITKKIKEKYPNITTIWGGYFASNQTKICLESGFVDFVINGPGDRAVPLLIESVLENKSFEEVPNLCFIRSDGKIFQTKKDALYDQDVLPDLPYKKLNEFYPIKKYLGKTYLGTQTIAYHSSFGCPFTCSFCAVVPIYNAKWKGKSAQKIFDDILFLKEKFGGNAIEFHDNNFFVNEKRVVEFSKLMLGQNMQWWGEGRIDTIDKYSDESLALMKEAGCKMIFFGAETGNDEILKKMDKGGKQSGKQIAEFAARMQKFGIVPEYSFVLGTPAENEEKVMNQINEDIEFIKKIKSINPFTEIIIYVYSPVATEGSEMYEAVKASGFKFPQKLEDWLNNEWLNFDLRKNPLTPWLTPAMIDKIKNFETVLNSYFPTATDHKLKNYQLKILKSFSSFRYKTGFYSFPYELKVIQKLLKYRQPEKEGF